MNDETATAPIGRPRSNEARLAVLHAVDDMLVEDGYAAMTMKGIAARAGVGKQTVYRWWSSKAEILLEAVRRDAAHELAIEEGTTTSDEIDRYLASVVRFLTRSHAGAAYRALVGEAQHDAKVAALIRSSDVLAEAAVPVVERAIKRGDFPEDTVVADAAARIVGPVFFRIMTGQANV